MARKTRFHQPETLYHVMLRGNDGNPIFFSDEDKYQIYFLMLESVQKFDHSIYAFCLMQNHIHLAIKVKETSVSNIIQNIAFRYTAYINKKYSRIGHLFQGRFKSIVVDENTYVMELIRYIHLNPVRAKLVIDPIDYHWSSHKAYLNLVEYPWLAVHDVLRRFGGSFNMALKNFEEYVLQGIGLAVPLVLKKEELDVIVKDEVFAEELVQGCIINRQKNIQLAELVEIICNKFKISKEVLIATGKNREVSHVRAVLAVLVRNIESISTDELALFLNRDSSSLFKLANRLEVKCREFPALSAEIDDLKNLILKT